MITSPLSPHGHAAMARILPLPGPVLPAPVPVPLPGPDLPPAQPGNGGIVPPWLRS